MRLSFFLLALTLITCSCSIHAQERWDTETSASIPYRVGDKWGFANRKGEIVIEPKYDDAGPFLGKVTWVQKGEKFALIDIWDNKVTRFKYDAISRNRLGQLKTQRNGKYECVDRNGLTIDCVGYAICGGTFEHSEVHTYEENGKIGILLGDIHYPKRRGMIDTLPAIWDEISISFKGYSAVRSGKKWAIMDPYGKLLTDTLYEFIELDTSKKVQSFKVLSETGWGIISEHQLLNLNKTILTDYTKVDFYRNGLAKVWLTNDFWGYVDRNGTEYFIRPEENE